MGTSVILVRNWSSGLPRKKLVQSRKSRINIYCSEDKKKHMQNKQDERTRTDGRVEHDAREGQSGMNAKVKEVTRRVGDLSKKTDIGKGKGEPNEVRLLH